MEKNEEGLYNDNNNQKIDFINIRSIFNEKKLFICLFNIFLFFNYIS